MYYFETKIQRVFWGGAPETLPPTSHRLGAAILESPTFKLFAYALAIEHHNVKKYTVQESTQNY